MKSIIYSASFDNCSVSFPIMYIINDQYVLIGPEYKVGIQAAISYKDYLQIVSNYVAPKTKSCKPGDRCLDPWSALDDNFYFSNIDTPLKCVMSIYFWVATKTNCLGAVPEPLRMLASSDKYNCELYIAKMISINLSKVDLTKSRDVYFSTLGGNPYQIVTEKNFSAACFISKYVPNLISTAGITDFNKTLSVVVNKIEHFAKQYNFLHGKTHIGHVSQDGTFIDFGQSFGLREVDMMLPYLKKLIPEDLYILAEKKAKIYDVDVGAACTLLEIYRFIDSIHTNTNPDFIEYHPKISLMKKWIIKVFRGYIMADESIFTYLRNNTFLFEGGCEPMFSDLPSYEPIKELFPTHYFSQKFLH